MRNTFNRVRLAVGVIVARIDLPRRACARMRRMQNAVHHRIAQVDVAGAHVDLGAQHARAVLEFAGAHPAEQIEVFLDAAVAERAVPAGLGERAAAGAHLVRRLVVDVSLARADQILRPSVELLEIIRGVVEVLAQSKPSQRTSVSMESIYSCSSLAGLVSSKRKLQ